MKLKINDVEYYIKEDTLSLNFNSMNDNEKWNYITKNKLIHKEDGPAIIYSDGEEWWYLNGLCHKLDGPAMILWNGTKNFCLNGKIVDEKIYKRIQSSSKEDLLVYMIDSKHKDFLPLIEYELNRKA